MDTSRCYFKNALLKRRYRILIIRVFSSSHHLKRAIVEKFNRLNCSRATVPHGHLSLRTVCLGQLTLMIPLCESFLFQVNLAVEEEIIEERQPGTEVKIEPENRNNNSPEVIVRPRSEDERSTQF